MSAHVIASVHTKTTLSANRLMQQVPQPLEGTQPLFGSGRGLLFAVSRLGGRKNIHARFEVHSCYGSKDISVLE